EDYDIGVARELVGGVDVWLNNPRRPHEASGTSGQKAALNGALNASVLDGWWVEGYARDPQSGFAIGTEEGLEDGARQGRRGAAPLYDVLENQIAPLFYERDARGIPLGWVARVKRSLKALGPMFNTHRMVSEYARRYYLPCSAGEPARPKSSPQAVAR